MPVAAIRDLHDLLGLPSPVRIVDIGANPMSHDPPYKALLAAGLCELVGFEPQKETMEKLQARKSPHETYFPDALGDGKKHRLNVYHGTGLTSLLSIRQETLKYVRGLRRAARLVETVDIPTRKLDQIRGLGKIDLVKIDVQGAEHDILSHGTRTLANASAVHTEVNFFPLYDDQPTFGDIDRLMRDNGFVPHSFLHIEKRIVLSEWAGRLGAPEARQMLDGDILYLRDLSRMDTLADETLGKTAMIAQGIYGLTDVMLRCLGELADRGRVSRDRIEGLLQILGKDAS